jgi:hypothetical protein
MLELLLCSALTILPDYLYRRYRQGKRIGLHVVDATGIVHAMLLRIQALLLPVKTLVLSGH